MAQCWTIAGGWAAPGIRLRGDPPGEVAVGEAGRGRSLTLVPVPAGATVRDGVLFQVPVTNDTVAVLLIRDHSGYRGSWRLTEVPTALCPFGTPGEPGAPGDCQTCGGGWSWHQPVVDNRPVQSIQPEQLGRVIARGYTAQGDAGRMGGGPEYLVAVRPGQFVIHRSGRLYGEPHWLTVTVNDAGYVTVQLLKSRAALAAW